MNRARPVDAALAALSVAAVALPLGSLFASPDWIPPSLLLLLVVAAVGSLLRPRVTSTWLVGAGQLAAVLVAMALLFVRDALWFGLPGPEALRAGYALLKDAYQNVQTHSAPAPTSEGTIFALVGLIALTALAVDLLAVTRRTPTAAGLPLLAAYLSAATNAGAGLAAFYFVIPAAVWVTMVGRQGVSSVRRWATAVSRADSPRSEGGDPEDAALDFAALGRVLGVGAIVAAVALTPLVPHLPTTFLADGLGRSDGARGGGGGIHLTSTLDVAANLESQSEDPVLVYQGTNRAAQTPLRVDVLNTYIDGQWREERRRVVTPTDGVLPTPPAASLKSSTPSRLKVIENRISAPQMALPDQATRVDAGNTPLALDFQGVLRVRTKPSEYTADFVTLDPVDADFAGDGTRLVGQGYLEVDRASVAAVAAAAATAIPGDRGSPVQKARDIQAYLRDVDFTYSLDFPPIPDGVDPITAFLRTKTGYCVQFATAMVMMARYEGIPARMAIGFLPGQPADGTYTVVAADAHAWPELFFPKLGWVRFEPTPGARTGSAPTYTIIPTDTGPTPTTTDNGSTASPTQNRPEQSVDPLAIDTPGGSTSTTPADWVAEHVEILLVAAVLALLGLLLPLGAWVWRRRRLRAARTAADRAEAEWQSLLARLGDVGISPPVGATPRQAGQYVRDAAYLDGESTAALGRVVATVERGRYAAPDTTLPEVRSDVRSVWRAASVTRSRQVRLRALLAPSEGVTAWSGWAEALLSVPRWLSRRTRRRH